MKRRVIASLLTLVLCLTLLPAPVFATDTGEDTPEPAATDIYVSSSGSDGNAGTQTAPYATLARAVEAAENGATIYVMSDLTMTECARFYSKSLTITSDENGPYTVTRGDSFDPQDDPARSTYNPAMIEVQTRDDKPAGLTLTNIILDDAGKHEGTVFAQAVSDDGTGPVDTSHNTDYVQDAIIASNATVPSTITLGDGAVLQNFGGMSAVRVTNRAQLVMKSGSVIEDTPSGYTRNKGTDTRSVGPAGAVWLQGGSLEMENGAKIRNINGRAVYADGGEATVGGTISGITGNPAMWQGGDGTAIHLRGSAKATLNGKISDCTEGVLVFVDKAVFEMATGSFLGNSDAAGIKTNEDPNWSRVNKDDYGTNRNTITIHGEISGIKNNKTPIQFKYGTLLIGADGNIHHNSVSYGTLYIQRDAIVDIYGKINNNDASNRGGGVATPGHGEVVINMYEGAEVKGNTAVKTGGGIMISSNTSFTMYGGEISGNVSQTVGGGIYQYKNNSKVELQGGTIRDNTMNATDVKEPSTGTKNDITISDNGNGSSNHYLYISQNTELDNQNVYFQINSKTVTPADDSLNIKLGNASPASVTALTTASIDKGWKSPLATFWVQRDGAAALTIGGLALDSKLPVYVLTQKTRDDGMPASSGAPINTYAAAVDDGNVRFTLPAADVNGSGCAVAIVQPTQDFGTLTISVPETIKQNKTGEKHSVPHTVTYDMSESLSSIIAQADGNAKYSLVITADDCLEGDRSFDYHSIDAPYTLPNDAFAVVDSLFASAELTVTVGEACYVIPSNVTETKLLGLESVVFDWNDGSSKTETMFVTEREALGDRMIADPARNGYTFTGWNTQQDGKGSSFDNSTVITGSLTVYAQWSENSSGGGGDGSATYYYFAIEKVDAQDGSVLSSAKFGLFLDGEQIATAASNRSGIAMFRVNESDYRKINAKSDLYYQELTAPEGYILNSDKIGIEKSDLTTSQTTAEKNAETVRNYQKNAPADLNGDDHVAYVHGYTDGTVKPSSNVTRAETAAMLYRLLTESRRNEIQTASNSFSDVSADDWYNESVSTMENGKYITGYPDGTFGGNKNITRAEFVAMLVRFIRVQNEDCSFTDVSRDYWAYGCIATATKAGWIAGYTDGTFKPEQPITRAEAMTIINRVLNRGVNEKSELMNFRVWPDNEPSAWYYYEVIEASNEHEYTGSRPSENWTSLRIH